MRTRLSGDVTWEADALGRRVRFAAVAGPACRLVLPAPGFSGPAGGPLPGQFGVALDE